MQKRAINASGIKITSVSVLIQQPILLLHPIHKRTHQSLSFLCQLTAHLGLAKPEFKPKTVGSEPNRPYTISNEK